MDDLETFFNRRRRISSSLPSSFDFPKLPFGCPKRFPFALAAANPSFVLSDIKSRSISAKRPNIVIITLVCKSRKDFLPYEIDLGFMSHRWQTFVKSQNELLTVLNRRRLEIAVFSYLADGLRCGDLYVTDSEEYADYREQLLPWEECERNLKEYCQAIELPDSAEAFVKQLKESLTQVAVKVDDSYPNNTELTIDEEGKPHLKRLRAAREASPKATLARRSG